MTTEPPPYPTSADGGETDFTVIDADIDAFRDTFPDIEELGHDTLRMVLLQGKLDTMLLAIQTTRRGFATERQARILNVLGREIRVILERQFASQQAQAARQARSER